MCEHPRWTPRARNTSPFIMVTGRASRHSPPRRLRAPPPVNLPLLSAPGAGAHSGSILCALAGVHTNPPACSLLFWTQEA